MRDRTAVGVMYALFRAGRLRRTAKPKRTGSPGIRHIHRVSLMLTRLRCLWNLILRIKFHPGDPVRFD